MKTKWYRFIFSDGYYIECMGMNVQERKVQEKYHGKLIRKELMGSL